MAGHTQRQWEGKFFRCGMRCWYCLKPLSLEGSETIEKAVKEHQTPRSRGGRNTIDNIVPACKECNDRKHDMTEAEFRTAFSEAFKILTMVSSPDQETHPKGRNLELINNPRLLEQLRREEENTSWAWKHPA